MDKESMLRRKIENLQNEIDALNKELYKLKDEKDNTRVAAYELYKQGMSFKKIGDQLREHPRNIRNWCYGMKRRERFAEHLEKFEFNGSPIDAPIEFLDLSSRPHNRLKHEGIHTVRQLMDIVAKGNDWLLAIRGFGDVAFEETIDKLEEYKHRHAIN